MPARPQAEPAGWHCGYKIKEREYIVMKILVLNCGSSSLKYQLIDMDNESVMA